MRLVRKVMLYPQSYIVSSYIHVFYLTIIIPVKRSNTGTLKEECALVIIVNS